MLTEKIKEDFEPGDRARGDDYFHEDRVRIVDESGGYSAAIVQGSRDCSYFVQIDHSGLKDGSISVSCECPRYLDGFLCKHIWATIRCVEEIAEPVGQRQIAVHAESPDDFVCGSHRVDAASKSILPKKRDEGVTTPWRKRLTELQESVGEDARLPATTANRGERQTWFVLSLADQVFDDDVEIAVYQSGRKKNGDWGKPLRRHVSRNDLQQISDDHERRLLTLLGVGATENAYGYSPTLARLTIKSDVVRDLIPQLCRTGRFVWTLAADRALEDAHPVQWDDGDPWTIALRLDRVAAENPYEYDLETGDDESLEDDYLLTAELRRNGQSIPMESIAMVKKMGLAMVESQIISIPSPDANMLESFVRHPELKIPAAEFDAFLSEFTKLPFLPTIDCGKGVALTTQMGQPKASIEVTQIQDRRRTEMLLDIVFRYGESSCDANSAESCFWDAANRRLVQRNFPAEQALLATLQDLPIRVNDSSFLPVGQRTIHARDLPMVASRATERGWQVIALGRKMRSAGNFDIQVSSGTDWFDVNAKIAFGDQFASLPALLKAVRQKKNHIVLDDGTCGILPEEWLARYGRIAEIATEVDGQIRFTKSQALLLDAMLDEQSQVTVDRDYTQLITKLRDFNGVKAAQEPAGFVGELRAYQRDGLGWTEFLREFGFGGCLADDMGLGKTVQVLAMLEARRAGRKANDLPHSPTLVVVPKSLIFNWTDEATKFAPQLKLVNYTGIDREERLPLIAQADVVLTTYGTVRRDVGKLKEFLFDYVILDESQAIKNASSLASKACRLLQSHHRLAMTGTPIENHIGELWTLLEFLNPGMLGSQAAFRQLANQDDNQSLLWLNQALRPFILRRTKAQVLTELPEKTEQTLYCEMLPKQRKQYEELRNYYRMHLSSKVKELGIGRSKIHVLEALLRLRQVACDPRLLDETSSQHGAKVELLLEKIEELQDEGHKAIIFSQFTSLLALVRKEFEKRDWKYEYLDGKSRKRGESVKRFQSDEECRLFVISIKAGGHGLNLTAADYVFILDPWWNPAVEAQAIDRAHRIGQTQHVMAYRMICRDTVEEKIIELQKSKRELADAVIAADESLLSSMSMEDLKMLFG